jgi:hypothetical protein
MRVLRRTTLSGIHGASGPGGNFAMKASSISSRGKTFFFLFENQAFPFLQGVFRF